MHDKDKFRKAAFEYLKNRPGEALIEDIIEAYAEGGSRGRRTRLPSRVQAGCWLAYDPEDRFIAGESNNSSYRCNPLKV